MGKAQRLVKQVKAWKKEGTLGQHKEEAVQALEEATRLYEEAEEKRLTRMGFDNKHVEINQLLRVVRTSGG